MKTNTTTLRIIDWVSKQMINIYKQSTQQEAKSFQPFLCIDNASQCQRDKNVEGNMYQVMSEKLKVKSSGLD